MVRSGFVSRALRSHRKGVYLLLDLTYKVIIEVFIGIVSLDRRSDWCGAIRHVGRGLRLLRHVDVSKVELEKLKVKLRWPRAR